MIDIHHHLIFGVDDGPSESSVSLAMAREAAAEGVTHIVCTPHASEQFRYQKEAVEERFQELRDKLRGKIELSLGCEMYMTAENVFEAQANMPRYSFNDRGYLLIEFGTQYIPSHMFNALRLLQGAGYTLIIAHPERYPAVTRRPELLAKWMRSGCLVQVTAGSLYGRFGRTAEAFANELLSRDWIHFVATDAHDIKWRPPHLKKCYEYIARRAGEETARRLCFTNPQAAVEGAKWPEQPVAQGLMEHIPLNFSTEEDSGSDRPPLLTSQRSKEREARQKSVWKRLFHEVRS